MLLSLFRKHLFCMFFAILMSFTHISVYADIRHTIKKGETLYKISKEYGVSLQELIDNNGFSNVNTIPVGTVVIIPQSEASMGQEKNVNEEVRYQDYIVVKGDTLFKLSKRYNVKISTLVGVNNLTSENLFINQKLKIPNDVQMSSNDSVELVVNLGGNEKKNLNTLVAKKGSISSFVNLMTTMVNTTEGTSRLVSKKWPVSGQLYEIDSEFPGVVIEANENSRVNALKSGTVVYAALHSSFNNVVIIEGNDGLIYLYGGQKQLYVKQGDKVKEGQKIGELGIMPIVQKAILYFSVWQNNRYVDPNSILG